MFRVYGMVDPRDESYFYVGLTSRSLDQRFWEHVTYATETSEKGQKIDEILAFGLEPLIKELEGNIATETLGREREIFWIRKLQSEGHSLTNIVNRLTFEEREAGRQTVYLDVDLRKRVKHRAIDEDLTISALILKAVQYYLDDVE